MNLLFIGGGASDTWTIRGHQLGTALGARCTMHPTAADWTWADLAILIKRAVGQWAKPTRAAGVPIVWDPIDFWQQPAQNGLTESEARTLFARHLDDVQPRLSLGATHAMAEACHGQYLPHHCWPGLMPTPPRARVQMVAYQGSAAYPGAWLGHVSQACERRGWRFAMNPPDIRQADLIVALRDGQWDGWMCREWKSGVKVVNALAAGRPIITQDTAAYREIHSPGTVIETAADLDRAFDQWTGHEVRQAAYARCCIDAPAYQVTAIAERYRQLLLDVRATCTA